MCTTCDARPADPVGRDLQRKICVNACILNGVVIPEAAPAYDTRAVSSPERLPPEAPEHVCAFCCHHVALVPGVGPCMGGIAFAAHGVDAGS